MRVAMKNAKTVIDDQDRARKAAVMGEVVASNKALDGALKQAKVLDPETPQSVAALVLVGAKYSGMNVKVSFPFQLFVIDSVRYNLTSCFIKVEKSDKFCLGDAKASSLIDSDAKSGSGSFTGQ